MHLSKYLRFPFQIIIPLMVPTYLFPFLTCDGYDQPAQFGHVLISELVSVLTKAFSVACVIK